MKRPARRSIRIRWDKHRNVAFRVYPAPPSGLYYLVRIFRTLETMRRFHARHAVFGPLGDGLGCCHTYGLVAFPKGGRAYTRPICGEIHLFRRRLTMRIITHECVHAGLGYIRRRKLRLDVEARSAFRRRDLMAQNSPEEQLCHAVGTVAAQIVSVASAQKWI